MVTKIVIENTPNSTIKKIVTILFITILVSVSFSLNASQRGLSRIPILNTDGKTLGYYEKSIALLVAVSDYTHGWPNLESVPSEMDHVEAALRAKGYEIVRINNPQAEQLHDAFANFIKTYGYHENNRLLFYYSGHGHTLSNGRKGYLVPADAPHPEGNVITFKQKALDMNQLISWARQMDAKHGLFLFDSCFSGTIFKQRNVLSKTPPQLNQWTSRPVRQFITAGSAGETVPANSTFTPAFIDGINGLADLNKDGYVIGTELGLFLQSEVSKYTNQTPQYGKIDNYRLSRGDYVFFANRNIDLEKADVQTNVDIIETMTVSGRKTNINSNTTQSTATSLDMIELPKEYKTTTVFDFGITNTNNDELQNKSTTNYTSKRESNPKNPSNPEHGVNLYSSDKNKISKIRKDNANDKEPEADILHDLFITSPF